MNTQLVAFNVALSRIAAIGYAKSITAFNLVGAPLPTHHSSCVMKGETAEPQPSASVVRAQRLRRHNARRTARRQQRRLDQMALALEQES